MDLGKGDPMTTGVGRNTVFTLFFFLFFWGGLIEQHLCDDIYYLMRNLPTSSSLRPL
jgi:hypothetical protein